MHHDHPVWTAEPARIALANVSKREWYTHAVPVDVTREEAVLHDTSAMSSGMQAYQDSIRSQIKHATNMPRG